jgi:hypothetical protein
VRAHGELPRAADQPPWVLSELAPVSIVGALEHAAESIRPLPRCLAPSRSGSAETCWSLLGVPPAGLRFYTVAYCTPHCPWPSDNVWSKRRARSSLELGILHAILTPRIGTRFMACNLPARLETWRAFRVARHDNAP